MIKKTLFFVLFFIIATNAFAKTFDQKAVLVDYISRMELLGWGIWQQNAPTEIKKFQS